MCPLVIQADPLVPSADQPLDPMSTLEGSGVDGSRPLTVLLSNNNPPPGDTYTPSRVFSHVRFEFGVNGGVSVGLDVSMGDGRGCGGLLWVGGRWVSMKVAASCEQDLIGVNRMLLLLSAQTCPKWAPPVTAHRAQPQCFGRWWQ